MVPLLAMMPKEAWYPIIAGAVVIAAIGAAILLVGRIISGFPEGRPRIPLSVLTILGGPTVGTVIGMIWCGIELFHPDPYPLMHVLMVSVLLSTYVGLLVAAVALVVVDIPSLFIDRRKSEKPPV